MAKPFSERRDHHTDTSDPNACWEWGGFRDRHGYGRVSTKPPSLAHRMAYEEAHGPIPEGLTIDHLCRNRGCVNPRHLDAVTGRVNTLRGMSRAALNATKTHCRNGHPFDEANTYRWRGKRACRTCNRETVARRTAARRSTEAAS